MAFKFEGKEMYPIFVFAKCCWSIHSKVVRFGKHAHSKQKKAPLTQTSASILYFFNIRFGMVQHQKQFGCREGRKFY